MKSIADVVAYLAYRIGCIYFHDRPLTYGGTPAGVELLLYTYHDMWAHGADRSEELEAAWRAELKREDCGSLNLSGRFAIDHPDADDDEICDYVIQHWQKITKLLAVRIPHERLQVEFAEHILVKKKQFSW